MVTVWTGVPCDVWMIRLAAPSVAGLIAGTGSTFTEIKRKGREMIHCCKAGISAVYENKYGASLIPTQDQGCHMAATSATGRLRPVWVTKEVGD